MRAEKRGDTVTMHRVLCFGGRDYYDDTAIAAALSELTSRLGVFAIIHGGARGADSLCGAWGAAHGCPVVIVPANWDFYGNRAGPVRNAWMLDIAFPTYAVGFPGGTGTADMLRRLERAGVPVWRPAG